MPSYFITGSSRGIGFAIVVELLKDPKNFVIASARNPSASQGLQDLASKYPKDRLALVTFDVSKPEQIEAAAKEVDQLAPKGLDYLINNAGISYQALTTFDDLDLKLFEEELVFNTVPLIRILRAFKPLVVKSTEKKVLFITSSLGSIQDAAGRPNLANAYSISKAALNMLARKWGAVNKSEGIISVLVHPGWVDTDLGQTIEPWLTAAVPGIKPLTVEDSAKGVVKVIQDAKMEDGVHFFNYDGTTIPF
ncbi:unnamed protein product [Somion occarium]|uniref:Uncharacterized protein n=1 Tax=Somion occarium TaxID=3059160 RepID=A0ABP1DFG3_9APHY